MTITNDTWTNVPTRTIKAGGVEFAYRELGSNNPGPPVIFLVHLAAVMDNWNPRVVDGLAAKHRVVVFDNRGIGASSGSPASSMEQMAEDAILFIKAMGFDQVDLFGFSMGGMIAQEIVLMKPQLVRKLILAGTGPAGGVGISTVARVTYLDMLKGWLTFQDPKQFLFFNRTPGGIRAGKDFLARIEERSENRDKKITVRALQAQLKALRKWGLKEPAHRWQRRHRIDNLLAHLIGRTRSAIRLEKQEGPRYRGPSCLRASGPSVRYRVSSGHPDAMLLGRMTVSR